MLELTTARKSTPGRHLLYHPQLGPCSRQFHCEYASFTQRCWWEMRDFVSCTSTLLARRVFWYSWIDGAFHVTSSSLPLKNTAPHLWLCSKLVLVTLATASAYRQLVKNCPEYQADDPRGARAVQSLVWVGPELESNSFKRRVTPNVARRSPFDMLQLIGSASNLQLCTHPLTFKSEPHALNPRAVQQKSMPPLASRRGVAVRRTHGSSAPLSTRIRAFRQLDALTANVHSESSFPPDERIRFTVATA